MVVVLLLAQVQGGVKMLNRFLKGANLDKKSFLKILLGAMIMSFFIVNVHEPSKITEGGVLGLTLFSYKVLGLDPAIVSPILDLSCFLLAFSMFGKSFLKRTLLASLSFALGYKLFAIIGPVLPSLYNYPLIAAVVGGAGIGIGCGLVISQATAAGGDDALALAISKKANINISKAYLFTDLVVLALSLVYIPFARIFYSLITVTVSSFLLGQFEVNLQVSSPSPEKASV